MVCEFELTKPGGFAPELHFATARSFCGSQLPRFTANTIPVPHSGKRAIARRFPPTTSARSNRIQSTLA